MFVKIDGFLKIMASAVTIANGYNAFYNYKMNKQKHIDETVANSVHYSYNTYVKEQKNNWTENSKKEAHNIAKKYFEENCIYYVDDITLKRKMDYKILEIKQMKNNLK